MASCACHARRGSGCLRLGGRRLCRAVSPLSLAPYFSFSACTLPPSSPSESACRRVGFGTIGDVQRVMEVAKVRRAAGRKAVRRASAGAAFRRNMVGCCAGGECSAVSLRSSEVIPMRGLEALPSPFSLTKLGARGWCLRIEITFPLRSSVRNFIHVYLGMYITCTHLNLHSDIELIGYVTSSPTTIVRRAIQSSVPHTVIARLIRSI